MLDRCVNNEDIRKNTRGPL